MKLWAIKMYYTYVNKYLLFEHREYVYNSPESDLNRYCVVAVCYNNSLNINNSIFIPDDCNSSFCVSETHIPTVPAISGHSHWFFSYFLYIGGAFHFVLSAYMLITFFIINGADFKLHYLRNICTHLKNACYKFYMYVRTYVWAKP